MKQCSWITAAIALATAAFSGSASAQQSDGNSILLAAANNKSVKSEPALESQLNELALDPVDDQRKSESLYIIQKPQSGTGNAWTFNAGVGKTINPNIFVESHENFANVTYSFNDRFFTKFYGARVYNEMTESGMDAWNRDGIFPNTSFVTSRWDLNVGFNLIYGKARITRDGVFYFNQYFAAGGGRLVQYNGQTESDDRAWNAEAGFSVWIGNRMTMNLGIKNYNYIQRRIIDDERVNQLVGFGAMGFRLGGAG